MTSIGAAAVELAMEAELLREAERDASPVAYGEGGSDKAPAKGMFVRPIVLTPQSPFCCSHTPTSLVRFADN